MMTDETPRRPQVMRRLSCLRTAWRVAGAGVAGLGVRWPAAAFNGISPHTVWYECSPGGVHGYPGGRPKAGAVAGGKWDGSGDPGGRVGEGSGLLDAGARVRGCRRAR